jgi:hypothetical protein
VPEDVPDAGEPPDAAPSASADAAAPEPPSTESVCEAVCDRALTCAKVLVDEADIDDDDPIDAMMARLRAECLKECLEEADNGDKRARAQLCMAHEDCDDFMKCVRELESD